MKIAIGCDPNAEIEKQAIIEFIQKKSGNDSYSQN